MIIALLLLAQTKTVTFTHPCANSAVVLEALGKELGIKMAASGSVTKDFIAVRFTNRSIDDVKRVMAETLNAAWFERNGTLFLDRGPAQEKKEEEQILAAFRDGIERFLNANPVKPFSAELVRQRMEDGLKKKIDPDDERRLNPELSAVMPATRFYARLVRALGTDTLLRVTEEKPLKLILRADGTGNMSPQLKKVLEDFVNEGNQAWDIGIQTGGTVWIGEYGPPAPVPLGYTITITRREVSYDFLVARDEYRDQKERYIARPTSRMSLMRGADPSYSLPQVELPAPTGKLPLTENALRMKRVFSARENFPLPPEAPSDEDRAVVYSLARDLVKNEPLAMFGGVPFTAAAEQAKRDYVALVPDYFVFIGSAIVDGKISLTAWKQRVQSLLVVEDESSKVLMVYPRLARLYRERRLDRAAASRFVSEYLKPGHLTLDALSDFFGGIKSETAMYGWLDTISPLVPMTSIYIGSFEAIKSYGALSANQRLQARTEGFVTSWELLPKDVQDLLAKKLLSDSVRFRESPPDAPIRWTVGVESFGLPSKPGVLSGSDLVPRGTTVRIRVHTADLLKPGPTGYGAVSWESYKPDQFAASMRGSGGDYFPDFHRAAVTSVERLHVDVHVPDAGYVHFAAQVDDTTKKTKYVSLNQLPEPWKTQLAEAIKKNGGGNP